MTNTHSSPQVFNLGCVTIRQYGSNGALLHVDGRYVAESNSSKGDPVKWAKRILKARVKFRKNRVESLKAEIENNNRDIERYLAALKELES